MIEVSALLKSFEDAIHTRLRESGLSVEILDRDAMVLCLQKLENFQRFGKDGYMIEPA
jgi:hypothetical protein